MCTHVNLNCGENNKNHQNIKSSISLDTEEEGGDHNTVGYEFCLRYPSVVIKWMFSTRIPWSVGQSRWDINQITDPSNFYIC